MLAYILRLVRLNICILVVIDLKRSGFGSIQNLNS